jgi:hypothetical protein
LERHESREEQTAGGIDGRRRDANVAAEVVRLGITEVTAIKTVAKIDGDEQW